MSYGFPLIVESLVAILLLITILYCVRLNNGIKQFKGRREEIEINDRRADHRNGDRRTRDCRPQDNGAGSRPDAGGAPARVREICREIGHQLKAGESVLDRLTQIAALRPASAPASGTTRTPASSSARQPKPAMPDTKTIMAAAQAFARTRPFAHAGPGGMIRLLREFRLIPIVLIAAGCLFALKLMGLMFDGGYLLGSRGLSADNTITIPLSSSSQELTPQTVTLDGWAPPAGGKQSWMREIFGFPDVTGSVNSGASPRKKSGHRDRFFQRAQSRPRRIIRPRTRARRATRRQEPAAGSQMSRSSTARKSRSITTRPVSAAERAILERLHERRQELDKRARELDMRESMLKEAEAKLDIRMRELKDIEAQAGAGAKKKEEAEASRFKNLATMYENMKAKDAAKIFDRLDIKVLLDMTSQINPRRMSEILAQMSPDAAERLTVELASRASGTDKPQNPANLPKIEGRPNGS